MLFSKSEKIFMLAIVVACPISLVYLTFIEGQPITPGECLRATGVAVEENQVGIMLFRGDDTYIWNIDLVSGHESYAWGGSVSMTNSNLLLATAPNRPIQQATPVPPSMAPARRAEILTELKSLEASSTWALFHKPCLHLEYKLNHRLTTMNFDEPLSPEVHKLMAALNINLPQKF